MSTRPLIKKSGGRGKAVRAWMLKHNGVFTGHFWFEEKSPKEARQMARSFAIGCNRGFPTLDYKAVRVLITEVVSVPREKRVRRSK